MRCKQRTKKLNLEYATRREWKCIRKISELLGVFPSPIKRRELHLDIKLIVCPKVFHLHLRDVGRPLPTTVACTNELLR